MNAQIRRAVLSSLLIGLVASSAAAHLMPAGHGTLNVKGHKAYIVASLPVGAFGQSPAAAAVEDGVLTTAELKANEATLRAAVRAGLRVESNGHVATFGTILLNLPTGADHARGQGTELMIMIVAKFPATPGSIMMRSTLWAGDAGTLKMEASVTEAPGITQREVAELTPSAPEHRFFAATPNAIAPAAPTAHQHHGQPHTH